MVVDMRDNTRMINSMVKVHLGAKRFPLCVINLFGFEIGKLFFSSGNRYEGEFKDDKFNG